LLEGLRSVTEFPWKAAIFDLDGTLLDSMGVWTRIDSISLGRRGIPVPDDYVYAIEAMTEQQVAEYTIARFGLAVSPRDLIGEWREIASEEYPNLPLKPGAGEYLRKVRDAGVTTVLTTSQVPELFLLALDNHGLTDLFDVIADVEKVGIAKSESEFYLNVADRMSVNPGDCIFYDDVLPALQSAKSIGMTTCGVFEETHAAAWPQIQTTADFAVQNLSEAPRP
jgi:HAD superfamily hydrolase (TIGR01509 family)